MLKLRRGLRNRNVLEQQIYITSPQTIPLPHTTEILVEKFQGFVSGMRFLSCMRQPTTYHDLLHLLHSSNLYLASNLPLHEGLLRDLSQYRQPVVSTVP